MNEILEFTGCDQDDLSTNELQMFLELCGMSSEDYFQRDGTAGLEEDSEMGKKCEILRQNVVFGTCKTAEPGNTAE